MKRLATQKRVIDY